MTTKNITIGGKTYPVAFNLQTIINYEEITGSIFDENIMAIHSRIAIIVAAILCVNPSTEISIDTILGKKDLDALIDINTAFAAIEEMALDFYKVPKTDKDKDGKPEEGGGDSPKNE